MKHPDYVSPSTLRRRKRRAIRKARRLARARFAPNDDKARVCVNDAACARRAATGSNEQSPGSQS